MTTLVGIDHLIAAFRVFLFQLLTFFLNKALQRKLSVLILQWIKQYAEQQLAQLREHILSPKGVTTGNAPHRKAQLLKAANFLYAAP